VAQIGNLVVRIGADARDFNRGIHSASARIRRFESTTTRMGRTVAAVQPRLLALARGAGIAAGALSGAAVATALLTQRFAEQADQIGKTASKVGLSTTALQELRFAAERSGVAAGTLDMALQRFSRRVAEAAAGGGELKGVLDELGISAVDSEGRTRAVEAVLSDVAEAMAATGSESDRLRIAFKAFDSEGAALVNMLKDGRIGLDRLREAARETGAIMSAELIEASTALTDDVQLLNAELADTRNQLMGSLVPAVGAVVPELTSLVAAVNEVTEKHRVWETVTEQVSIAVAEMAQSVTDNYRMMALGVFEPTLALMELWERYNQFSAAVTGRELGAWLFDSDDVQRVRDYVESLREGTDLISEIIARQEEATSGNSGPLRLTIGGGVTGDGAPVAERFQAEIEQVRQHNEAKLTAEVDHQEQLAEARRAYWQQAAEARFEFLANEYDKEQQAAQRRMQLTKQAEDFIRNQKLQTASMAASTLQQMAGDSKAAAIAAIALNKGVALANIAIQTAEAMSAAVAPPPLGLGPVAGVALAAKMTAFGAVQAALVTASGIGQAAGLGAASGGGGGGGGRGGVPTEPAQASTPIAEPRQTFRVEGLSADTLVSGEQVIGILNEAAKRGLVPEYSR